MNDGIHKKSPPEFEYTIIRKKEHCKIYIKDSIIFIVIAGVSRYTGKNEKLGVTAI